MNEEYQQQITARIKEAVNNHIDQLQQKHSDLHITRQWKVKYPKGFISGNNILPVITGSKLGNYLIGEVRFFLPDSLELDPNELELILKDEPFPEEEEKPVSPPALDDQLELLNEMVLGVNSYLQSLTSGFVQNHSVPLKSFTNASPPAAIRTVSNNTDDIEAVKKEMLESEYLPDWFKTVSGYAVREQMIQKLAEGYIHYGKQVGKPVPLKEFFDQYTSYLLKQNKLHHYCRYKGKPVILDGNNWCTENYCSKKPYRAECSVPVLKFGGYPDN